MRRRIARPLLLAALVGLGAAGSPGARAAEIEIARATPFDASLVLQARALRGLRTGVVGEMFTAEDGGELAVAALAVATPGSDGLAEVPVAVEIDGATFLEFNDQDVARLEVYVYALTAERQIADYLADVFVIDVGEHGERVWQSGFEYFGLLQLPPGAFTVKILVLDFHSGARGLTTTRLDVPDFSGRAARALSPLFPEPAGRDLWIPVRSWETRERGERPGYPLRSVGGGINPSVRPVLVPQRRTAALVPIVGGAPDVVRGEIELLSSGGDDQVIAAVPLDSVTRIEPTAVSTGSLSVAFEAPEVAPGFYRVRLTLWTAEGVELSPSPGVAFVASRDLRETAFLWTDMRWLLAGEEQVVAESVGDRRGKRRRARDEEKRTRIEVEELRRVQGEIARRYRALVEAASESGHETTLAALLELEAEALHRSVGQKLDGLRQAELAVASMIGERSAEALLPLAMMHTEIYARYRGRRMYPLLNHTRALLEDLTDLYIELGGDPQTGARILVNLAGNLQDANLAGSSRRLFLKALEMVPDNEAALLGLAASLERYGEYSQAIVYLEQLVVANPDFAEGRLRLAVNLERVGLRRRTLDLLGGIVRDGGSDWVASVAVQELARLYLQMGNAEGAAEVLEIAVARMPEGTGSRLLLAHVYDRLGFTRRALERLDEVDPAPGLARSERYIYDRWPQALLEQSRAQLTAAVEVARQESVEREKRPDEGETTE